MRTMEKKKRCDTCAYNEKTTYFEERGGSETECGRRYGIVKQNLSMFMSERGVWQQNDCKNYKKK
jgi:hypothetical protein